MVKDVGLIFRRIHRLLQKKGLALLNARVMSGGQKLSSQRLRLLQQPVELHILVAGDAGVRRLAGHITVFEIGNNRLAEILDIIKIVMRDVELLRDGPRIIEIAGPATAAELAALGVIPVARLERNTDNVVALLFQKSGGDGTVYSSR